MEAQNIDNLMAEVQAIVEQNDYEDDQTILLAIRCFLEQCPNEELLKHAKIEKFYDYEAGEDEVLVEWEIGPINAGCEFGYEVFGWSVNTPDNFACDSNWYENIPGKDSWNESLHITSFQEFYKTLQKHSY